MRKLLIITISVFITGCAPILPEPQFNRNYDYAYDRQTPPYKKQNPYFYPNYNPAADNPYKDFSSERYEPYPKYDPSADNPYYPPYTYLPFKKKVPYEYKYPKFNPEADNPYYPPYKPTPPPPPKEKRQFDKPLFETPMFVN